VKATFRRSAHLRAVAWVAPCVGAWSLIPRLATNTGGLDPYQYLFASSVVSALTLAVSAVAAGRVANLRAYASAIHLPRLAALSALGAFGYYALLYSAYAPCAGQECPGKPLVIIVAQYTWPALGVVWAALLLGDPLNARTMLSLAAGIAAVWVGASTGVALGDAREKLPIVLFAAAIFGLYSTLVKKFDDEPFSSLAWIFAAAAVMSGIATLVMSRQPWPMNWTSAGAVLINGTFVNGLSYVCWQRALREAPMAFVAPWICLTPLCAAMMVSRQFSGPTRWAGIGLVLLSVLLATIQGRAAGRLGRWGRQKPPTVVEI
jgi:drug/metabolite transporter (DMT)-like permease